MAGIAGLEPQRLFAALVLLVTALFLAAGAAPDMRWRRRLRRLATAAFAMALAVALVEVALWLVGRG